jgi:hypothetical protein
MIVKQIKRNNKNLYKIIRTKIIIAKVRPKILPKLALITTI